MLFVIYWAVDILWDQKKNKTLKDTRGVSFEDIAQIILDKKYLAILGNPSHPDQMIFVLSYKRYTYVVPFVVDVENNIVLKTVYPSRKFHRIYGKEKQ